MNSSQQHDSQQSPIQTFPVPLGCMDTLLIPRKLVLSPTLICFSNQQDTRWNVSTKNMVLTSRWGILLDKNMRQIAKNGFQEHFKMVQKGCSNNSEYLFQKISDTDRFELIIILSVCLGNMNFVKLFG